MLEYGTRAWRRHSRRLLLLAEVHGFLLDPDFQGKLLYDIYPGCGKDRGPVINHGNAGNQTKGPE